MKARAIVLAAVSAVIFALSLAGGDDVRYQARLTGQGKGKAVYKIKAEDRGVQSELQVEAENLARNRAYTVWIGKSSAWNVQTDSFGRFEVRSNTRTSAGLSITTGTPVVVTDVEGDTVLSGAFTRL
jgi:hypothetical protein